MAFTPSGGKLGPGIFCGFPGTKACQEVPTDPRLLAVPNLPQLLLTPCDVETIAEDPGNPTDCQGDSRTDLEWAGF